jgi:hypothetical protein
MGNTMNKLGHYGKITSGLALSKTTFHDQEVPENGLRLIRPQDLNAAALLNETHLSQLDCMVETPELSKRIKAEHYLREKDILLTARGTSYQAAMIDSLADNQRIIMSNNMICLRPHVECAEPILLYLNSEWFKQTIIEKEFPKMLTLTVKWVTELPFDLPELTERQHLSQALRQHQELLYSLEQVKQKSKIYLDARLFDTLSTQQETTHGKTK